MKISPVAMLIIVGMAQVVNAGQTRTLDSLIKEALATGESIAARADEAKHGGVKEGQAGKALSVDSKSSTDGYSHDFTVFLDGDKPVVAIFAADKDGEKSREFINLACDLKGKMRMCYRAIGDKDASGNPIPGSMQISDYPAKDKKMAAALKHEMDFWLKGLYRKAK